MDDTISPVNTATKPTVKALVKSGINPLLEFDFPF